MDLTLFGKKDFARDPLHEIQSAGALDLTGDAAMKLGRNTGGATGVNLAGIGREVPEELGVQVIHLLRRDVETTTGHAPVGAAKVDGSLFSFGAHSTWYDKRLAQREWNAD